MRQQCVEAVICLEFHIASQGSLVDLILYSRALYIQPGVPGDRLSQTMEEEKIIVEIPQTGFELYWDKMWEKHLIQDFKKRGLSRKEAKLAAKDFMQNQRKIY